MRSSKSRSRNKNNRNRSNNLGNVVNRVFDSSGPEGKVRGTPQQIIDKYNQLARDAQLGNDRVATENFQQHAEHYMRMLSEAQREQDARREQQEKENRERQAQRDRERAERDANRDTDNQPQPQHTQQPSKAADPAEQPQPDVIDMGGDDAGLVETPESRSQSSRKPSSQKPAAKSETATDAGSDPAPAKADDQPKPKKPRAPRKPRKKPETTDAAPAADSAQDASAPEASTPSTDAAE